MHIVTHRNEKISMIFFLELNQPRATMIERWCHVHHLASKSKSPSLHTETSCYRKGISNHHLWHRVRHCSSSDSYQRARERDGRPFTRQKSPGTWRCNVRMAWKWKKKKTARVRRNVERGDSWTEPNLAWREQKKGNQRQTEHWGHKSLKGRDKRTIETGQDREASRIFGLDRARDKGQNWSRLRT